eukprot:TRINITY_DN23253_c0_g1_i1.p1 TRINITY_DN23253_c0_g1~~TRINITY_DN23253_c0_g1_i1.p1  ORF type:complete len:447 (+),score=159.43 TRINITY_DN23253_c0_g1_i1:129-1469(+)
MASSTMWFAIFALLICLVKGLSIDRDIRPFKDESESNKDMYRLLTDRGFGFLKHGRANIHLTPKEPGVKLNFLMCSESQYLKYFGLTVAHMPCDLGEGIDAVDCRLNVPFGGINMTDDYTLENYDVDEMGQFYFVLAKCGYSSSPVNVHMTMLLLNPYGQQLSFGEIPMPPLYTLLMACWLIVGALWTFNWLKHRQQKSWLHRVISVYPLAKAVYCAVEIYYYSGYGRSGTSTEGMHIVLYLASIFSDMLFYATLLLLSSGWCVTRDDIGTDKFYIAGLMTGLVVTRLITYLINPLIELLAIILNIAILTMIFRWIARNRIELALFIQPADQPNSLRRLSVSEKDDLFSYLRTVLFTYIIADLVIIVVQILFLLNLDFISSMLHELLEMLMFICAAYVFKLRPANAYNLLDESGGAAPDGAGAAADAQQPSAVEMAEQVSVAEAMR